MDTEVKITIRIDATLNERAAQKIHGLFGIGLSTFVKIFLKSFVDQKNIGFYMGDHEFNEGMARPLRKRQVGAMRRERKTLALH